MKHAIDLFSGTESATKYFQKSNEWTVHTVDNQQQFNPDTCKDIRKLQPKDLPEADFIWASPPCTCFSIAKCWKYWGNTGNDKMNLPAKQDTVEAVQLVYHALYLINELNPDHWIMENPRGYMRKIMPSKNSTGAQGEITYCQYGYHLMKPTNLWGDIPESFEFRKCSPGSDCHSNEERGMGSGSDHVRDPVERSKIPDGLARHVYKTVEESV